MRKLVAPGPHCRPRGAGNRRFVLCRPAGKDETVVDTADGLDAQIADRKTAFPDPGETRLAEGSEVDVETIASGREHVPGRGLET